MDTGPELSRTYLITPGLSLAAGGSFVWREIMCGFISFMLMIMLFPLLVAFALAWLLALLVVVSPFIFVGWLIGELIR